MYYLELKAKIEKVMFTAKEDRKRQVGYNTILLVLSDIYVAS